MEYTCPGCMTLCGSIREGARKETGGRVGRDFEGEGSQTIFYSIYCLNKNIVFLKKKILKKKKNQIRQVMWDTHILIIETLRLSDVFENPDRFSCGVVCVKREIKAENVLYVAPLV